MDLKEIELRDMLEKGTKRRIFPLQTKQSMAERWGVTRQTIAGWAKRYPDFPKPLEGVIEETKKPYMVYPLFEVERYEKLKGLKHYEE